MKKLILILFFVPALSEGKDIVIKATDDDVTLVEKRVINAKAWLQAAWDQKVANSKEALIKEYTDKNLASGIPLKPTKGEIIQEIIDTFDSRKERDAKEK